MRNGFTIILFILNIILLTNCKSDNKKTKIIEPEFLNILKKYNVHGSILIYDNSNNHFYSNDFLWAEKGKLPASTFKIPNSLIALETGVIESDTSIIYWNGQKRALKKWEQNLTFKQAFQYSCVPCYQEIARKIGYKKMKEYLQKMNYNTMVFDSHTIDNFWLEGKSKINQFEQIDFLKKLYRNKLPLSDNTLHIVKNIMKVKASNNYTLYAKTGWSNYNGENNGWYIGFLESENQVYFFATNIEPDDNNDIKNFPIARIEVTMAALKVLNIIE